MVCSHVVKTGPIDLTLETALLQEQKKKKNMHGRVTAEVLGKN